MDILVRAEDETGLKIKLEPTEPEYLSRTGLAEFLGQVDPYEIKIAFKPSSKSIDYAIAHEAVRVLRYQKAPPGERYAIGSTEETEKVAYRRMEEDIRCMPPAVRAAVRDTLPVFYQGQLIQLCSIPGDFWINKWLLDNYPGFREEIEIGLSEVVSLAHQALGKDIKTFTPSTIYKASNSVNAAFMGFAGELLGKEEFSRPYRGTKFEGLGAKLRGYNLVDRGHPGDKNVTDSWARELGLEGWYGWKRN